MKFIMLLTMILTVVLFGCSNSTLEGKYDSILDAAGKSQFSEQRYLSSGCPEGKPGPRPSPIRGCSEDGDSSWRYRLSQDGCEWKKDWTYCGGTDYRGKPCKCFGRGFCPIYSPIYC
jgi:hypothetical protein